MTKSPESPTVVDAYGACERITRHEARNFSYGIRLLPPPKRRALSAVYAMARRIDDIGDGDLPEERKLVLLDGVRRKVRDLEAGRYDEADPVLVALAATARDFAVPLGGFVEIVEGCEADVRGVAYSTFDDLRHYCRCVAGSVGRLSLGVFGTTRGDLDEARELADTLGLALQVTNILRDILEDRRNGRVYLPKEDLDRFGVTLELDGDTLADDPGRLAELVRFEAGRAEERYATGLRLLARLDRRSAACVAAMAGIYHRLLRRIEADPAAVMRTRVRLSGGEKARVAVKALTVGRA